jgi:hypothetical protein
MAPFIAKSLDKFHEAHPEVKIDHEYLTEGYYDRLNVMLASGTLPDVINLRSFDRDGTIRSHFEDHTGKCVYRGHPNDAYEKVKVAVGQALQLEYATNLGAPNWTSMGGQLTMTNSTLTITDSVSDDAQRFYRVLVIP